MPAADFVTLATETERAKLLVQVTSRLTGASPQFSPPTVQLQPLGPFAAEFFQALPHTLNQRAVGTKVNGRLPTADAAGQFEVRTESQAAASAVAGDDRPLAGQRCELLGKEPLDLRPALVNRIADFHAYVSFRPPAAPTG